MEERFTIREIARLTGIPPATLRKWEERYGIVTPIRLPNGYREYTPTHLAALRWVKVKVDGGALVSTAADELNQRRAEGWEPTTSSDDHPALQGQPPGLASWESRLVEALLNRDIVAVSLILDFIFSSFSLETALIDVVQSALDDIGDRWESGEISEYQEHYSSVVLRDRLGSLRGLVSRTNGPLFLTACVPGELHELGAIILGLVAARRGFRVVHLGASPSPEGLKRAVVDMKPSVLGLSVSNRQRLHGSRRWLKEISLLTSQELPSCTLVIGGLGARDVVGQPIAGFFPIPGDARAALQQIERLMEQVAR